MWYIYINTIFTACSLHSKQWIQSSSNVSLYMIHSVSFSQLSWERFWKFFFGFNIILALYFIVLSCCLSYYRYYSVLSQLLFFLRWSYFNFAHMDFFASASTSVFSIIKKSVELVHSMVCMYLVAGNAWLVESTGNDKWAVVFRTFLPQDLYHWWSEISVTKNVTVERICTCASGYVLCHTQPSCSAKGFIYKWNNITVINSSRRISSRPCRTCTSKCNLKKL